MVFLVGQYKCCGKMERCAKSLLLCRSLCFLRWKWPCNDKMTKRVHLRQSYDVIPIFQDGSHGFPSSLDFSDSTRFAMSKSISTPNFDKIAKSRAVLILLVTLENEHPSYMNYTSGLHLIYWSSRLLAFCFGISKLNFLRGVAPWTDWRAFGVLSGVPEVITHAKFCVNRLRVSRGQHPYKCHFLYLFERPLQKFCTIVQTVMCANFSFSGFVS